MKRVSKETKIVTIYVLITLLFLSCISTAFGYFTASAKLNNDTEFSDFGVSFGILTVNDEAVIGDNTNTITITTPNQISRGVPFDVYVNGDEVMVAAVTSTGSTSAYVRYWLDAYIVKNGNVDTTTNYGEYFSFWLFDTELDGVNYGASIAKDEDSSTYYLVEALTTDTPDGMMFDQISLNSDAPADLLGASLRLTISFEAVQVDNGAFSSVFDDERGYCSEWV